jgi:16S rRNA (guanine(966)-N(2))-methyltransferase RsmD
MRIIAGKYKGFIFPKVKLNKTRPTTDRSKEALFSILESRYNIEDKSILDLFCGTGGIGFEFLSRGASSISFVDSNFASINYVKNVASLLKVDIETSKINVYKYIEISNLSYDIVFADPPYFEVDNMDLINKILSGNVLKKEGIFILEHQHKLNITNPYLIETRNYGQSSFSFFKFEPKKI